MPSREIIRILAVQGDGGPVDITPELDRYPVIKDGDVGFAQDAMASHLARRLAGCVDLDDGEELERRARPLALEATRLVAGFDVEAERRFDSLVSATLRFNEASAAARRKSSRNGVVTKAAEFAGKPTRPDPDRPDAPTALDIRGPRRPSRLWRTDPDESDLFVKGPGTQLAANPTPMGWCNYRQFAAVAVLEGG